MEFLEENFEKKKENPHYKNMQTVDDESHTHFPHHAERLRE